MLDDPAAKTCHLYKCVSSAAAAGADWVLVEEGLDEAERALHFLHFLALGRGRCDPGAVRGEERDVRQSVGDFVLGVVHHRQLVLLGEGGAEGLDHHLLVAAPHTASGFAYELHAEALLARPDGPPRSPAWGRGA